MRAEGNRNKTAWGSVTRMRPGKTGSEAGRLQN